MKNIFEKPEIEILLFDEEDITAENSTVVQEEMTAARAVTAMMGDDKDAKQRFASFFIPNCKNMQKVLDKYTYMV